jgi:hypothetical protein
LTGCVCGDCYGQWGIGLGDAPPECSIPKTPDAGPCAPRHFDPPLDPICTPQVDESEICVAFSIDVCCPDGPDYSQWPPPSWQICCFPIDDYIIHGCKTVFHLCFSCASSTGFKEGCQKTVIAGFSWLSTASDCIFCDLLGICLPEALYGDLCR